MSEQPTASLYRMVMPDHVCPYGLKAKDLLEREGFEVDDHFLELRDVESFSTMFLNYDLLARRVVRYGYA